MPREFAGCIYHRGHGSQHRSADSYKDIEIPPAALRKMQAQMIGGPVHHGHREDGMGEVGKITDVWFDKYDGCHARFQIDEPFLANFIKQNVQDKSDAVRGLSISHKKRVGLDGQEEYAFTELSVCNRGARFGSVINCSMTPDAYKVHTSSENYSPADALEDNLNHIHILNGVQDAILTMEPQGPAGNPHIHTEGAGVAASATTPPQGNPSLGGGAAPPAPQQQQQSDPPVPVEDVISAIMSLDAPTKFKEAIFSALDAQRGAVLERDAKLANTAAELAAAQAAVQQIQAKADHMQTENDAFASRVRNSVEETITQYLAEVSPEVVSKNRAESARTDMMRIFKEHPSIVPAVETWVQAARYSKKRSGEDELELQVQKFRKSGYAFASPEQQVMSVQASRAQAAGKGKAPANADDSGPAVPGFVEDHGQFQRYLAAANYNLSKR